MTTIEQYLKDREKISYILDKRDTNITVAAVLNYCVTFIAFCWFARLRTIFDMEIPILLLLITCVMMFFVTLYVTKRISNSKEEKLKSQRGILYRKGDLYIYKDCAFAKYYFLSKRDCNYINVGNGTEEPYTRTIYEYKYTLEIYGVGKFDIEKDMYDTLIKDKPVLRITGELYDRVISLISEQK